MKRYFTLFVVVLMLTMTAHNLASQLNSSFWALSINDLVTITIQLFVSEAYFGKVNFSEVKRTFNKFSQFFEKHEIALLILCIFITGIFIGGLIVSSFRHV